MTIKEQIYYLIQAQDLIRRVWAEHYSSTPAAKMLWKINQQITKTINMIGKE